MIVYYDELLMQFPSSEVKREKIYSHFKRTKSLSEIQNLLLTDKKS